jgi:hypothetical protein
MFNLWDFNVRDCYVQDCYVRDCYIFDKYVVPLFCPLACNDEERFCEYGPNPFLFACQNGLRVHAGLETPGKYLY